VRLLPPDALVGVRVGLSVSESPDLARLGMLEVHFRLALGEITRTVVVAGGDLISGGRLDAWGYTPVVTAELARYARRDRPLLACLVFHEHRRLPLSVVESFRHNLGLLGRLVCLDLDGAEMAPGDGRGEAPSPVDDPLVRQRALDGLRRYMNVRQQGRVFIGGRRAGFEGLAPGLIEEALLAVTAGQPVFLAAGFGGVTWDIACALGVDSGEWLPRLSDGDPAQPGLEEGCRQLRALAEAPGWAGLRNGLTDEENVRLAATHRPSEIASLVGLGLGRLHVGGAQ
jgi:hypothetical protein